MLELKNKVLSKFLVLILVTALLITVGCSQSKIVQTDNTGIEYIGYGANKTVSGSLHIISIDGEKIMLDAGSFYGDDKNQVEEFPKALLKDISAIVISHAVSASLNSPKADGIACPGFAGYNDHIIAKEKGCLCCMRSVTADHQRHPPINVWSL